MRLVQQPVEDRFGQRGVRHGRVPRVDGKPDGMTSQVHEFDPREGGSFRASLTYESADGIGKTTNHTNYWQGS